MNSRRKFHKLLLAFGVLLLFGLSAVLPGLDSVQSQSSSLSVATRPWKEPRPDHPGEALRFRRLQMQDEKGFIPPDGLEKARQQVALMKAAQQQRKKTQGKSTPSLQAAGIEPDSWTWIGPGNIGGRIRAIVIDPISVNTMWVGSVSGGIWRTTDAGGNWQPVNDFLANLAVSTMVINPANSNIMFAGTGEGFLNVIGNFSDHIRGAGVFQSTDRGATWNQLASTNNANFFFVNRLAISPNGNMILAATNTGIWRSINGGTTWTQATFAQTFDIDLHPTGNSRAIAGTAVIGRP